ncbi:MAG: SRPBCC domain-containing protein [Woeseia sp.]
MSSVHTTSHLSTPALPGIPPVRRSVDVSWDPDAAFRRFTADFESWWPTATHSIGGKRVARVIFECREGGGIVEELVDGRRFQWGTVTRWDPPHAVGFSWHPSRDASTAQDVEVTFTPAGAGTRVELTSSGWERLGAKGRRERKGYNIGWGSVMATYAGQRSVALVVFAIISAALTFVLRVTGRLNGMIDAAGGRLPDLPR